jgi:hypothetical protein
VQLEIAQTLPHLLGTTPPKRDGDAVLDPEGIEAAVKKTTRPPQPR